MPDFIYPIDLEIQYNNNIEYRHYLRMLFKMNSSNFSEESLLEDLDDETRDELEYDESSAIMGMDWIYSKICDNTLFQILFDKAAAKFLSENREIGIAVLLSYDYLALFHNCMRTYLTNPADFTEIHPTYLALFEKL
jgi:hypothetical protein